jgi:peptidoglycan biosynthesis protein MviN/MurJ (putative lipid II flippase)
MSFTSPTLLAGLAALAIVVLTLALIPVLRHRELNEGQKWDVTMKIVGACAVFVGVVVGLYQYIDKAGMESRKPFLERQLVYYLDASSQAAILATSSDAKEINSAAAAFWRLLQAVTEVTSIVLWRDQRAAGLDQVLDRPSDARPARRLTA